MEIYLSVERGGEARAVSHHQEAAAGSRDQIARESENVIRRRLVKVTGGFVGEKKQRLHRQRPADRDPLLLASRQLFGIALEQTAEPEPLNQFGMPGSIVAVGDARLEHEVVFDIQARDQVELLKHQT